MGGDRPCAKDRGSYSFQTFALTVDSDGLETAIHEFGHRVQQVYPSLQLAFRDLHVHRTTQNGVHEKRKKLKDLEPHLNYESYEVAREDRYVSPYFGREYEHPIYDDIYGPSPDGEPLEVLTMTFQYLLSGDIYDLRRLLADDPELAAFGLALLRLF